MRKLGPGVTYSNITKMYTASLGVKTIGHYRTLEEAAKHYNEKASALFTFPILNKHHTVGEEEVPTAGTPPQVVKDVKEEEIQENSIVDESSDFDIAITQLKDMKL